MNKLSAIDLFSGCGGLTLGLKQAGFSVLAAVETEGLAVSTYRANHPEVNVKHTDIRRLSPVRLRKELGLRSGQLGLLAGCPPCQGFSTLRTQNGAKRNNDQRNYLVAEMLRFAKAFRPKAVMMENVPRLKDRKAFKHLCDGLTRLGYQLIWDVKDAADFGVPQRRKRLILLATRQGGIKFGAAVDRRRSVKDAIGNLPCAGKSGDKLHDLPEKRRSEKIRRLIRDIPKNGGSRTDLPLHRQLRCHRNRDGFRDIYGRMSWTDVAPTITGGCFNPSKGRFLHPSRNRAITLREAALLQSFPRNYKFDLSQGKEAAALLIGNALPPEFVRRHAVKVRQKLLAPRRKESHGRSKTKRHSA